MNAEIGKRCCTCKIVKPFSEFYDRNGKATCFSSSCKVCSKKNSASRRAANKLLDPIVPEEKKCCMCGQIKSASDFYKDRSKRNGLTSSCKSCTKKRSEEWILNNEDSHKRSKFNCKIRNNYKITWEEYFDLLETQNHVCAICRKPERQKNRMYLCTDHDHKTNLVRGLLCSHCNKALGLFGDDVGILTKAIEYLLRNQPSACIQSAQ